MLSINIERIICLKRELNPEENIAQNILFLALAILLVYYLLLDSDGFICTA